MSQWHREKICLVCGSEFNAKRSDALYCSKACRSRNRTLRIAPPALPPNSKLCGACREAKPLTEFGLRAGGRAPKAHCRACVRAYQRQRNAASPEKARERARRSYRRNAAAITERTRDYKRENRSKARAHSAVEYALTTGRLVRPDACEECGAAGKVHGHHEDYSRQLDVRWLCPRCHKEAHGV